MVQRHNKEFYGLKIILLIDTMFGNKFYWHFHQPINNINSNFYGKQINIL